MTTLVLLPGMDGTGRMFADFVAAMQAAGDTCQVVAYPPDRHLDYTGLEAFVRERLPADKPYVLLGESFSGPIALSLAASRPPGLQALVLVCTFVASPMPSIVNLLRAATPWLPVRPLPTWLIARLLYGRLPTTTERRNLAGLLRLVSPPVMRGRLRAVLSLGEDLAHRLQDIQVPVLYLQARRDRLVGRTSGRLIHRHHPETRLVRLDGPHFLLQTRPQEAAAAIRAFLRAQNIAPDPTVRDARRR